MRFHALGDLLYGSCRHCERRMDGHVTVTAAIHIIVIVVVIMIIIITINVTSSYRARASV